MKRVNTGITVNDNHHASCNACGKRPDALLIHLEHSDDHVTLCESCGLKLAEGVSTWIRSQVKNGSDEQ